MEILVCLRLVLMINWLFCSSLMSQPSSWHWNFKRNKDYIFHFSRFSYVTLTFRCFNWVLLEGGIREPRGKFNIPEWDQGKRTWVYSNELWTSKSEHVWIGLDAQVRACPSMVEDGHIQARSRARPCRVETCRYEKDRGEQIREQPNRLGRAGSRRVETSLSRTSE